MPKLKLIIVIATALLSACIYKIDIQQGNVVQDDKVEQIEIGMEERQVVFLLGNPVARDAFRDDRWTYVYYYRSGDGNIVRSGQLVIYWDADRRVSRVERDGESMRRIEGDLDRSG